MPAATPPASAPTPAAMGSAVIVALRPVRKSLIGQSCFLACSRSSLSGLIATASPTRDNIGRSLAESL